MCGLVVWHVNTYLKIPIGIHVYSMYIIYTYIHNLYILYINGHPWEWAKLTLIAG